MAFKEGNTESRGRKKGSLNRNTLSMKDNMTKLLESNMLTLDADLRALSPKDRVNALINLAKFCIPTLKAVEQDIQVSNDLTWLDQFSDQDLEKLLNK
jgi:hypothetical protein